MKTLKAILVIAAILAGMMIGGTLTAAMRWGGCG